MGQCVCAIIISSAAGRVLAPTQCVLRRLKCIKFGFGLGSAPDPAGGAHERSPDPLVGWGRHSAPPHSPAHRMASMPAVSPSWRLQRLFLAPQKLSSNATIRSTVSFGQKSIMMGQPFCAGVNTMATRHPRETNTPIFWT